MNALEETWRRWQALSKVDKARFLALFREAYLQEREAVVRENGSGAHRGHMVSTLADLTLTEADFLPDAAQP